MQRPRRTYSNDELVGPVDILLGRQAHGLTPEAETAWARLFLMVGFLAGSLFASCASDEITQFKASTHVAADGTPDAH